MDIMPMNERQSIAQQVSREVDCYLTTVLSSAYTSSNPTEQAAGWSLLIQYQDVLLPQPCVVGRVLVNKDYPATHNGTAGLMQLLTEDQVQEIRETAAWEVARQRGELARNKNGYISRHQARRLARRWLDQHLSMKFSAINGQWLPLNPPLWQFTIEFTLQTVPLKSLGVITVNAQTGVVTPISAEQLDYLREHVCAAIQLCTPSATA